MKILARLDKVERKTYKNKYRSVRNPMEHVMKNAQNKSTDVDIIDMESHGIKTVCLVKSNNFSTRG